LAELMDRAYAIVVAASPLHPTRSRLEWLVGEHDLGVRAIDDLLAGGFLKEVERGKRLMLGERTPCTLHALSIRDSCASGEKSKPRV
jgi:hypothetical protein